MISGAVTQCHALPGAPEHLKGLGVLTITASGSYDSAGGCQAGLCAAAKLHSGPKS